MLNQWYGRRILVLLHYTEEKDTVENEGKMTSKEERKIEFQSKNYLHSKGN